MISSPPNQLSVIGHRLVRWWRERLNRGQAGAELRRLGYAEFGRVAHDVGLTAADLSILAGKWPDSADLLSRRIAALEIDQRKFRDSQPQVLRDMQRVCTLCSDKGRCEHDLGTRINGGSWQSYCPNASTLLALADNVPTPAAKNHQ